MGLCEREGPSCNAADCVPGSPRAETCNLLDDDCNGAVDDGELCESGQACLGGECATLSDDGTGTGDVGGATAGSAGMLGTGGTGVSGAYGSGAPAAVLAGARRVVWTGRHEPSRAADQKLRRVRRRSRSG